MANLLILQGLPASGKTAWALEQCAKDPNIVRVSKDDIRAELRAAGWVWSQEGEKEVIKLRDLKIYQALAGDHDVISDDTNLGRKHKVRLSEIARQFGADFEVKSFLNVTAEECIKRDAARPEAQRVGASVIKRMQAQYRIGTDTEEVQALRVERVVPDPNLPRAILCDLDGTLSLFKEKGHRGPYDATLCEQDDVNPPVLKLLGYYHFMEYAVIYLSGREDKFREPTERFLRKHQCPQGPLYMRSTGDFRKDFIIKGELFDAHVRGVYNIEFVLDDRNQVVKMWRRIGLQCWQVNEGAF